MLALSDTVTVALIGSVSAILVGGIPLLTKLVTRTVDRASARVSALNTEEHLLNKAVLERIDTKVDHLGNQFGEHLTWHLGHPTTTVNVHPKEAAS